MQMKTIRDFPEYAAALARFETLQNEQAQNRERQITIDAERTKRQIKGQVAAALHAELEQLQRREPALLEELEDARQELDRIRNRISPGLSEQLRANSVARIQENVAAIKTIVKNNRLDAAERHALESGDVSHGSVGPTVVAIGGVLWSDEFPLAGYLRQVTESFPELKL